MLGKTEHPERLREYYGAEKALVAAFTVSGIVFNAGQSYVLVLQGRLLDTIVQGKGLRAVALSALTLILTVLFIQANRYVKRFGIRRWANRTIARMRLAVYSHILSQDLPTIEKEDVGDLLTRAVGDVDITVEGMRKVTTEIFDTGILMAGYAVTLCLSSVKITLLSVWCIPLSMFLASRLKSIVAKASRTSREQQGKVTGMTYAMAQKTVLLRTASAEEAVGAIYRGELGALQKAATRASILESSLDPVYKAVASLGFLTALWLGGKEVVAGTWTVGAYSSYIMIYSALTVKASHASRLFNAWQKARVSYERIRPLLLAPAPEKGGTHPLAPSCDLVVSHLSFRYPGGDRDILRDVSFRARPGEIIGVTGPVASGKSTLGVALEGLYPYQGSITLGGQEIRNLTGEERGSLISWQGHRSELISASIEENIRLGREGDVMPALREVCFDEDLRSMPDGVKTRVGSAGVRLSGGQAERIAVARALFRPTPLVILDDPFASVDRKTENAIIAHLRENHGDSIVILISHRLAIFPDAEQVLYVHQDGTVERGDHESLMESCPDYRKMYSLQSGGKEDGDGKEV